MAEEANFGVARLRQAITNQAACGSGQFELSIDSADRLCLEIEDELTQLAWANGVPAPKDADGEVVPLTTKVMYDDGGEELTVRLICYRQSDGGWVAEFCRPCAAIMDTLAKFHLRRPDTWEKLEEDAKLAPRAYLENRGVNPRENRAHRVHDGRPRAPRQGPRGEGRGLMDELKLKPCPFCGHEPELLETSMNFYVIRCIPYRLGTGQYCRFEGSHEYVHMGDLVKIYVHPYQKDPYSYCGNLYGVEYDGDGFISSVSLLCFGDAGGLRFVDFGGAFYHAETTNEHLDPSDRRRAAGEL